MGKLKVERFDSFRQPARDENGNKTYTKTNIIGLADIELNNSFSFSFSDLKFERKWEQNTYKNKYHRLLDIELNNSFSFSFSDLKFERK